MTLSKLTRFEEEFGLTVDESGRIVTTSLKVKDIYGKEHKDVLKKIRGFIDLIPELGERNFSPSYYINEQNKKMPMYLMDRQGFSMLVNKFTTDEATIFTYKYTQAFEEMAKEIEELKNDIKVISKIALSDEDQSQRLLEMNQHDFSERRTKRTFQNCVDYTQYLQLYSRFLEYTKSLDTDTRVIRYLSAIKGMEQLRVNLIQEGSHQIGNSINIDTNVKELLQLIDKTNNRRLGGEKGAKTKKIRELTDYVETLESQLESPEVGLN